MFEVSKKALIALVVALSLAVLVAGYYDNGKSVTDQWKLTWEEFGDFLSSPHEFDKVEATGEAAKTEALKSVQASSPSQ